MPAEMFQAKPDPIVETENIFSNKTEFSTNSAKSSKSLHYFRDCFRLLYYTLVIPYRFEFGANGEICIQSNPLIKYFVGLLHFYGVLLHLQWLIGTIQAITSNSSLDPNTFCMFLANIVLIYGSFNFLRCIWFKKEEIIRFFEILAKVPRSNAGSSGYTFFELTEIFLSLGTVLLFSGLATAANPWIMIGLHFGMDLSFMEQYKVISAVYKFLTLFIFCFVVLLVNVSSTLTNVGCIAVYRMGEECTEILRTGPKLEEVTEYYESLKEALGMMNSVIGGQVLVCVINVLIYFSKTLVEIFESKHVAQASVAIMYIIVCIVFLLLAAIGSKKLGKIDEYLFRNRNVVGFRENLSSVLLLKEDISFNPLGLKAYEFVINFGFLVSVFSTVITYLVVLLQFPRSKTANIFP